MIQRIDNVGVVVSDLDRALRFYQLLGFEVQWKNAMPSARVEAGEAGLWLFQSGVATGSPRSISLMGNPLGVDHVSLWVGEVDAACDQLRGNGVELETEPADQDWGFRAASVLDPDGTRLFLLGPLSKARA
jgi:methylmalonyl-CoA/ethylmalonyl-CoA epimerase